MNRDHRLVCCSPRSARSCGSPSSLSSSSSSFFLSSLLWASERRPSLILPASNNRKNANETNSHATVVVVLNLPVRFNFFLLERSEFPVRESPLGPDRYRSCKFAPTQRQKERHELSSACNSSSSKWNRQMSKGSSSPRRARR